MSSDTACLVEAEEQHRLLQYDEPTDGHEVLAPERHQRTTLSHMTEKIVDKHNRRPLTKGHPLYSQITFDGGDAKILEEMIHGLPLPSDITSVCIRTFDVAITGKGSDGTVMWLGDGGKGVTFANTTSKHGSAELMKKIFSSDTCGFQSGFKLDEDGNETFVIHDDTINEPAPLDKVEVFAWQMLEGTNNSDHRIGMTLADYDKSTGLSSRDPNIGAIREVSAGEYELKEVTAVFHPHARITAAEHIVNMSPYSLSEFLIEHSYSTVDNVDENISKMDVFGKPYGILPSNHLIMEMIMGSLPRMGLTESDVAEFDVAGVLHRKAPWKIVEGFVAAYKSNAAKFKTKMDINTLHIECVPLDRVENQDEWSVCVTLRVAYAFRALVPTAHLSANTSSDKA
jgi:hypothetical protein